MRLNYEYFDKYLHLFDMTTLQMSRAQYVKSEIDKRIEKYKQKEEEIENLKYESNLIVSDIIGTIREDLEESFYNIFKWYQKDILSKTWKFSRDKDNEDFKKDKKEYDEHKACYEVVINRVKVGLIPEKYHKRLKLVEIIDFNYETEYEFKFQYKTLEFIICTPVFHNATKENYTDILSGYKLKTEDKSSCITEVSTEIKELNPDKFREKLGAWLGEKLCKKNQEK